MSSPTAVQASNLVYDYPARGKAKAQRALDGVTFDVRRGEIFALLGPNGGGKTTLFKILSTAVRPTQGTAAVFGYDIQKQADDVRRRIDIGCSSAAWRPHRSRPGHDRRPQMTA